MDCGSLGHRALSAGLADWTETPCGPRGEPEGRVNTKLIERAPLWDRLTSSRAQPGGDMEPSRWPDSGEPPRSLKASAWPFDQCWNHRQKTLDTASCCVSPSSGNQSACGWETAVFISKVRLDCYWKNGSQSKKSHHCWSTSSSWDSLEHFMNYTKLFKYRESLIRVILRLGHLGLEETCCRGSPKNSDAV